MVKRVQPKTPVTTSASSSTRNKPGHLSREDAQGPKPEEKKTEDKIPSSGAVKEESSMITVAWTKGPGARGMFKEPRKKDEVAKALAHGGGMRNPHGGHPRQELSCGTCGCPFSKDTRKHLKLRRDMALKGAS